MLKLGIVHWAQPRSFSEEETANLLRGGTVCRHMDGIRQFDVFRVPELGRTACCYYADERETWSRLLTGEETSYMEKFGKEEMD